MGGTGDYLLQLSWIINEGPEVRRCSSTQVHQRAELELGCGTAISSPEEGKPVSKSFCLSISCSLRASAPLLCITELHHYSCLFTREELGSLGSDYRELRGYKTVSECILDGCTKPGTFGRLFPLPSATDCALPIELMQLGKRMCTSYL